MTDLMQGPTGLGIFILALLFGIVSSHFILNFIADAVFKAYFDRKLQFTKSVIELTKERPHGNEAP